MISLAQTESCGTAVRLAAPDTQQGRERTRYCDQTGTRFTQAPGHGLHRSASTRLGYRWTSYRNMVKRASLTATASKTHLTKSTATSTPTGRESTTTSPGITAEQATR